MSTRNSAAQELDRALAVDNAVMAAEVLAAEPLSPGLVRAVASRVDAVRFQHPRVGFAIAEITAKALKRVPARCRRPSLISMVYAAYGSACRNLGRFDEAEAAFAVAVDHCPKANTPLRSQIARRVAYLRADQKRPEEAIPLIDSVVDLERAAGGISFGRGLADRASILVILERYALAEEDAEAALRLLPASGDHYHLSAVYHLARCRQELADSSPEGLQAAVSATLAAVQWIDTGTQWATRLRWLAGKLLWRLGRLADAAEELTSARQGIERFGNKFERALVLLDLSELQLERCLWAEACELALNSFGLLSAFRDDREAYKAVWLFYEAAAARSLDIPTIRSAREMLLAAA